MTVMAIKDIPRIHVGQSIAEQRSGEKAAPSAREELAVKAKSLLGYRTLLHEVTQTVESGADIGELGKALLAADIEILDAGAVFEYQVREAARRTKAELDRLLRSGDLKQVFRWGFHAAAWQHTAIKSYSEPIPEFVLNKAVQIKEAVPTVEFYIHHLNEPKADPFLVAMLADEVYFIEVWEEPRFEGRLDR